jgi:hypothetical protein
MSIQDFVVKAGEDDSVMKDLVDALSSAESGGQDASQAVVGVGAKHGYTFSADEAKSAGEFLKMQSSSDGELSDEQLEMVAGGGWIGDVGNWLVRNERPINDTANTVWRVVRSW